jgi:ABC-type thiamin/hydroxymethylpyrimidine transport system permease subunit
MQEKAKAQDLQGIGKKRYFSTVDLVVVAILAALGNVISSGLDMLKPIFKGSPIPVFQLMSGYHLIWMALGFGITRKAGAPTFVAGIKGILEFMFWDPFFGPWVILLNLVEGVMLDAGFYLFRRIRSGRRRWMLAGMLGNAMQPLVSYSLVFYYLGKPSPDLVILLVATTFSLASGCLITGLLGFQIDVVLHRPDVQAFISQK